MIEPPPSRREGDAEALSVRATDLVARDLARLGATVWPRPASVIPPAPGTVPLSVVVRIGARDLSLLARAGTHTATTSGTVEGLDAASSRLAMALAPRLGLPVASGVGALLGASDPTPELVHRALGQAALDLTIDQPHRARLRFGRAEEIWRGTVVPDALDGTWSAMLRAARSPEEAVATADPLARSALESADMAPRDDAKAITALSSALRYWTDRALGWALPLDAGTEVHASERGWWLTGAGEARMIEPRTGAVREARRFPGRWVGALGEDALVIDAGQLVRLTPGGVLRWKRALPWKDARADLGALAGGFVLVHALTGVAWIDASTGAIVQADPGARVLSSDREGAAAVGLDGALVRLASGELALLRSGRRAPAWTAPAGAEDVRAVLVPGRALLLTSGTVRILDTATGKARGSDLDLGGAAPSASAPEPPLHWLGAEGRHAVIGVGRTAIVLDALAGHELARVMGPGAALAATAAESGLAVGFETGDVFLLDREGAVADRARVVGRPRALWPGRPHAPGFLVRTDRGLTALGPVPGAERPRDVDVALRLAERCRARGDVRGALRLLDRVALQGAGRVAEAEAARAVLLAREPTPLRKLAAAAALRRAAAARDLGQRLPPFSLE